MSSLRSFDIERGRVPEHGHPDSKPIVGGRRAGGQGIWTHRLAPIGPARATLRRERQSIVDSLGGAAADGRKWAGMPGSPAEIGTFGPPGRPNGLTGHTAGRAASKQESDRHCEVVMALVNSNWQDMGERLDAVALKLKMHLEQSETAEVTEAVGKLRHAIAEAFDATGNALRDEAVRADVREAGRLFVDAVAATFAVVSGEVRERIDRRP
jgi:hypothetical protein